MSFSTLRTRSFCGTGKPVFLSTRDVEDLKQILLVLLKDTNLCVSVNTATHLSTLTDLSTGRLNYLLRLCKKIAKSGIVYLDGQYVHWNTGLTRDLYFNQCNSLNDCYLATMNYFYKQNVWRDNECKSGTGSSVEVCGGWINTITSIQKKLGFSTWVDLCCGQFRLDVAGVITPYFDAYLGMDISSKIIGENKAKLPNLRFRDTKLTKEKVSQILEDEKITKPVFITIKHALQHMDKATQTFVLWMCLKTFPVGSVLVFTTFKPSVLDEDGFDIVPGGTIGNCSLNLLENFLVDGVNFANCSRPLPDAEYVRGDGTCAVVLQITSERKFTLVSKK